MSLWGLSGRVRLCYRVGLDRAGQSRAGQGRAGQGRAGQGRAGQGRAGQGRAGQGIFAATTATCKSKHLTAGGGAVT